MLVRNIHCVVWFTYNEVVKVGYRAVSSRLKMEELDSLESPTEENGVGRQTNVVRKKREVRDRKRHKQNVFVFFYSCSRERICACIYV